MYQLLKISLVLASAVYVQLFFFSEVLIDPILLPDLYTLRGFNIVNLTTCQ